MIKENSSYTLEIQEVIIKRSEFRLEGRYYCHPNKNAPAAIILSPHPLHGGTMNNKVCYKIFHTLINKGFSVLRFNFRGVGKSHGKYDGGTGELHDAALALDWLQSRHIESSGYWVIGFSFGSWINLQLLMRRPEINAFISIAPPVTNYSFDFISPCPIPGLIIQGSDDQISKPKDSYELFKKLDRQKNSNVEYKLIQGADHFFDKHIYELSLAISNYVERTTILKPQYKKSKRTRSRKESLV